MGIKNLHTTIDYKELIERQANTVIERVNPKDKLKTKCNQDVKVKKKVIKRK